MVSANNNQKMLLGVLGLLIAIKFVLFPIVDWQNEQVSLIAEKKVRLAKVDNVIEEIDGVSATKQSYLTRNSELMAGFYQVPSSSALKLTLQKELEQIFSARDVKIQNFSWATEIPGDVTEIRANIAFRGTLSNLIKLQMDLEQNNRLFSQINWSLQVQKMNKQSLGTVRGRMLISAFNYPVAATKIDNGAEE